MGKVRLFVILMLLISITIFSISCSKGNGKTETEKEILYWTCSMHPEVRADEEGNCPICGMNLIPVYEKETSEGEGSLYLNEKDIELAGIRMVPSTKENLYKEIHTVGKIAYDPNLVIAQEEYVNALFLVEKMNGSDGIAMERAKRVLEKSNYKLRLLGMDETEIKELNKTRQVETSLIIPENETWVYADVYESDIGWIKKGQKVAVTSIAYPGEEFHGEIKSINPVLNPRTRSIQIRVQLSNSNGQLRPGMFVDVKVRAVYSPATFSEHSDKNTHKILAIPKESVIDTGNRKVVWVYLGNGNFQPREVKIGPEAISYDENRGMRYYPVLSGLKEDELVVTNGNFLIDSESQITGIASIGYGGALGVE